MEYCPSCGTELKHDGKFCSECGLELDSGDETSQQPEESQITAEASISESKASVEQQQNSPSWFNLLPDEEILHAPVPGKATAAVTTAGAMIPGLIYVIIFDRFITTGVFYALVIPVIISMYIRRRYVITNKRVIKRGGILTTKTSEIRVEDIRSISTKSGWTESIFGKGTVVVTSTGGGSSGGRIDFTELPNYEQVANTIRKHQEYH